MTKQKRDIGAEILDGLREIKGGEIGRVINVPDVAETRKKTGLSQARFARLLGVSVRTLQDGNKDAVRPLARHAHSSPLPRKTRRCCWMLLDSKVGRMDGWSFAAACVSRSITADRPTE